MASVARARGVTVPVVIAAVAALALIVALWYPGHRDAVATERLGGLTESVTSAAVQLTAHRVNHGSFPEKFALNTTIPAVEQQYIATSGNQAFSLTSEHTELRLWAGVNSAGVRCHCKRCVAPAIFNQTTTACPAGTTLF